MNKSILDEAATAFKAIAESENVKLIFTCPACGAEHDLAELIALVVENNLKELSDLACSHCHHTFDLSETKEFENIRKDFFKAIVRIIAKMKNVSEDDVRLSEFVNTIMEQK